MNLHEYQARAVLKAAGKTFADVVKVNVYLTDMKDFPEMNAVYGRHFEVPYPARTTVAVAALPLGAAVEIELMARRTDPVESVEHDQLPVHHGRRCLPPCL